MKSIKIFNIDNEKKLALVNTLIFALIAVVLYFTLPTVLNYPPNSIDNNFQIEIVGIKYTTQFLIIISILLVLLYIALRIVYNKLSLTKVNMNNNSKEYINTLRKKAFNYPYIMLLLELFVPSIIITLLLFAFNTEFELVVRITTVVFSFSAVFAIFSYMLSKKFFSNRLVATAKIANNKVNGIRLPLFNKLLIQILPLFLYSFVLILLISMSLMTKEKGELLYHFYRQELLSNFDDSKTYTIDEIKDIFDLDSERFQKPIYATGNERFRAMAAVGFSSGKDVFCFPWMSKGRFESFHRNLTGWFDILEKLDKIIIAPLGM